MSTAQKAAEKISEVTGGYGGITVKAMAAIIESCLVNAEMRELRQEVMAPMENYQRIVADLEQQLAEAKERLEIEIQGRAVAQQSADEKRIENDQLQQQLAEARDKLMKFREWLDAAEVAGELRTGDVEYISAALAEI